MTFKAAIFIYIRAQAFGERAGNNNELSSVLSRALVLSVIHVEYKVNRSK